MRTASTLIAVYNFMSLTPNIIYISYCNFITLFHGNACILHPYSHITHLARPIRHTHFHHHTFTPTLSPPHFHHHTFTTTLSSHHTTPITPHSHSAGGHWSAEQEATFKAPILHKYERESHAFYSSARLWDDGIIDPADTRKVMV